MLVCFWRATAASLGMAALLAVAQLHRCLSCCPSCSSIPAPHRLDTLLQVKLRSVSEVVAGQTTEVFRRYPVREAPGATRSLSLHYKDEEGSSRTLDLTCADEQQFELWHTGLRVLAHRLRSMGTPVPVGPAATAASAAAAPPLGSLAGPGGASPGEVARCLEKSRMLQVGRA